MKRSLEEPEEWISDVKVKVRESNETEQKRESIMEHKNRHKELNDFIEHYNILTIGVPEEEEREKGVENIF